MSETIISAAKSLYAAGWNIMPLVGKKPVGEWAKLQRERGNIDRIVEYLTRNPECNLGIIAGEISGVSIIDIDVGSDGTDLGAIAVFIAKYPTPLCVRTGKGGYHLYYRYRNVKNAVRVKHPGILMDVRSQGGYVVCPPSIHPDTRREYVFVSAADLSQTYDIETIATLREQLPEFPEEIAVLCSNSLAKTPDDWRNTIYGTVDGSRNHSAASLCGKLVGSFKANDWASVVWPLLYAWNNTYVTPPLSEKELKLTFESICRAALRERQWGGPGERMKLVE